MMKKPDMELLGIALVIAVSAGHIGYYLSGFEMPQLAFMGYVQALAIDVSLVICAYRMRRKSQRWAAMAGWLFFSGVSAIFNGGYYAQAGAASLLAAVLGCWAPIAGALLGLLKSTSDMLEERKAKAAKTRAKRREEEQREPEEFAIPCPLCDYVARKPAKRSAINALNGHMKRHRIESSRPKWGIKAPSTGL